MTKLLTLQEVAEILRITYWRCADLARQGVLPGVVKLGRQYRIDPRKLEEFIQAGGRALPGGWRRQPKEAA